MMRTQTAMFLIMMVLILTLMSEAHPTTEMLKESNVTSEAEKNTNVQLAITHVVKTIEFEVDVVEDNSNEYDNSTDMITPEYIETNIKLLDVNLLKEVLAKATENETETASEKPEEGDLSPEAEP